ncbi:activating transcription factor 7-interacting protein 2-like [Aphis craccivora]|uniref:Activating transcription factor 7-interacting protein 2-like n=1 Tax=Aphis craccivora TaxID=307492 RepID=A0A6G0Y2Z0_APHCR|nr:activating transcription factor 7-interacting protein 2-like [Aphis craccivora]
MNENKMNNYKAEETKDQNHDPQISIKLDNEVIKLPRSKFDEILDREITKYIMNSEAADENIIDPKELVNVEVWEKKFEKLSSEAKDFHNVVKQLENDLKINKFAQPMRCTYSSVRQNVNICHALERQINTVHGNTIKDHEIFTISSDSEDQSTIITDTSITKPTTMSYSESDNNSKKLNVKYKPCPKSKKKFSKRNVKVKHNGTNKVIPLNTELDQKNLTTVKCLSTTTCKGKTGRKSKTMFVDDMISSNSNCKEPDEKKICLNNGINVEKSKTTNLSDCNSSKKEVTNKLNIRHKFSSSKYPPPYPLVPPHNTQPLWKNVPPTPNMSIKVSGNKVTLTWNLNLSLQTAEIKMYELFVCQETDAHPDISMWKKKGNIKAEMLPMACELEIFELGYIYYFALRAVDVHNRCAPFALQKIKI